MLNKLNIGYSIYEKSLAAGYMVIHEDTEYRPKEGLNFDHNDIIIKINKDQNSKILNIKIKYQDQNQETQLFGEDLTNNENDKFDQEDGFIHQNDELKPDDDVTNIDDELKPNDVFNQANKIKPSSSFTHEVKSKTSNNVTLHDELKSSDEITHNDDTIKPSDEITYTHTNNTIKLNINIKYQDQNQETQLFGINTYKALCLCGLSCLLTF